MKKDKKIDKFLSTQEDIFLTLPSVDLKDDSMVFLYLVSKLLVATRETNFLTTCLTYENFYISSKIILKLLQEPGFSIMYSNELRELVESYVYENRDKLKKESKTFEEFEIKNNIINHMLHSSAKNVQDTNEETLCYAPIFLAEVELVARKITWNRKNAFNFIDNYEHILLNDVRYFFLKTDKNDNPILEEENMYSNKYENLKSRHARKKLFEFDFDEDINPKYLKIREI